MALLALLMMTSDHGEYFVFSMSVLCNLLACNVCFGAVFYAYVAEIFPVSIRCTALSVIFFVGRLGGVAAPLVFTLASPSTRYLGRHSHFWLLTCLLSLSSLMT